MLEKIQSLQESWDDHGHWYMADHKRDEAEAGEAHLNAWAGKVAPQVWRYLTKREDRAFLFEDIEEALVYAGGNIDEAIENLTTNYGDGFDDRSETLSAAERNPGMTGKYHD